MSLSTMIDAFDTPMADETGDTVMQLSGSSENSVWYQSFSEMDEDGRMHQDEYESLEVDMLANEYDNTVEYEMGNESYVTAPEAELDTSVTAAAAPVDTIQDTEVLDASVHPSPLPIHVELEHGQISAPSSPGSRHHVEAMARSDSLPADNTSDFSDSHRFPSNLTHSGAHDGHHSVQSDDIGSNDIQAAADAVVTQSVVKSHVKSHVEAVAMPQHSDKLSVIGSNDAGQEAPESTEETRVFGDAIPSTHSKPSDAHEASRKNGREEDGTEQASATSNVNRATGVRVLGVNAHVDDLSILEKDQGSSLQASHGPGDEVSGQIMYQQETEQVYADNPPPISLTLQVTSSEGNQPEFALFSLPDSVVVDTEGASLEEPLLLLQHKPSLFYEPISLVFEAFRQEEYFSHLEELSDAEMVLNAYDLQLAISEDNVYAREVSLHDFYAMHQGLGLPGHLRLALQSVVPRFISRYNFLRDQLTRQVNAVEPESDVGHEEAEIKSQQSKEFRQLAEASTSLGQVVGSIPLDDSHDIEDHVEAQGHDQGVGKTQKADEGHDYSDKDIVREQLTRDNADAQRSGKDEGKAEEKNQVELEEEIGALQKEVVDTAAPRGVSKEGEEGFDTTSTDGVLQAGDAVHYEEHRYYIDTVRREVESANADDFNNEGGEEEVEVEKEEEEKEEEEEEEDGANEIEDGDGISPATTEGIPNVFEPTLSRGAAVQMSIGALSVFGSSRAERSKPENQATDSHASEQADPFIHDKTELYDESNDAEYDDAFGEDDFEQDDLGDDIQGSSEDTLDDADNVDGESTPNQLDTAVSPRPEDEDFEKEDQDGFYTGGSEDVLSPDDMRRAPNNEFGSQNSAEQTDEAHYDAGKKRSKRRLHDAEEEEETQSPPDIPDSKRARVLRHRTPVS